MRATVPADMAPALYQLGDSGACAHWAVGAFPSNTAPGHAALWTGAYGNVNGIAANWQPVLPRSQHTILDSISGFDAAALRAEPIWITAARAGRRVVSHHVSQTPGPPGFPATDSVFDRRLVERRLVAAAMLALPNATVLTGYNRRYIPDLVIDHVVAPPHPAIGWQRLDRLGETRPPLEIAWATKGHAFGGDTLFGLLYGRDAYTHMLVSHQRDVAGGVVLAPAPAERFGPASPARPLARWFSEPLAFPVQGGAQAYLQLRLFELAPDASRFLLYQPALAEIDANRPDVAAAYADAVRGWLGSGAGALYRAQRFGQTLEFGGDGRAEDRWLETLEYVTRQFEAGAEWSWNAQHPSLLLDYFPVADAVDHELFGWEERRAPRYDPALAARARAVRQRGWELVDHRVAHAMRLAAAGGGALFVTGDHGMRATWRVFRPNVALARAGLLALDPAGRVDLARTKVFSPNGAWVMVNRTAWKGGIVPPAEERALLAAAERALGMARDERGQRVVTHVWRAANPELDSLGIGGPAAGDLYYDVAPGFRWAADLRGNVSELEPQGAEHGHRPTEPEMRTAFCAWGPAFRPHRIGPVRVIDVAPTVAEWLGIPAPAAAVGRSVLTELLKRR